jgi:SagB-type dehydrogenase family enzyme
VKLDLPPPTCSTTETVEQAISARRSCREYSDKPISLEKLSQLLWSAQGITGDDGQKAAPSAGRQYPLQVYVVVGAVSGLSVGLYRYNGRDHSLLTVSEDDLREVLRDAALEDQPWVGRATSIIVITADFGTTQHHFREQPPKGERGDRYVYIETGAVAENVHMQAIGLGIGVVLVAGFDDSKVRNALDLPQELEPTALLCIGELN